ncbi:hypothetical protein [Mesorhizobium sp.]|uniref:hypothetical protein n=1 Tax=Mesorhizobium sp. TaxID=1871066 RepID=UPI0025D8CA7C|nr:hypothetical protein [Mesorhizobium sp.]
MNEAGFANAGKSGQCRSKRSVTSNHNRNQQVAADQLAEIDAAAVAIGAADTAP